MKKNESDNMNESNNMKVKPLKDDLIPGKNRVVFPMDIRFSDTDANGHVFFGNYFTLFDTAFLKYLKSIGYPFNKFLEKGLNFYYVEAKSSFKSPVKFDDEVCVEVQIDHLGKTSFRVEFEAINRTNSKTAAKGHIVAVVVNLKTEKPSAIPDDFIQAIGRVGS